MEAKIIALCHGECDWRADRLTREGFYQVCATAVAITAVAPIIYTSPAVAAVQSAQIIQEECAAFALRILPELDREGNGEVVASRIIREDDGSAVIIVVDPWHLLDGRGVLHSLARQLGMEFVPPRVVGGGKGFLLAEGVILPFPPFRLW